MNSRFSSDFFIGNRQRLKTLFTGTAPIVMTANGLLQRGGDSSFRFAQDASFWYLTGIEDPDIVLVMDRDKEYLIVPTRSASREKFDGSVSNEVLSNRSGIKDIFDEREGWERLGVRLKKVKHAATLAPVPAYLESYGMYSNPARASLVQKMKTDNPNLELLDLGMHICIMRMIKQPVEIAAMQSAIDITCRALKDVARASKLKKYSYEYDIEAELTRIFRKRGASGHAFEPIVAGGSRACRMHYVSNDTILSADELVVLDIGAEVEHYSADVARTISMGTPSRRQQTVHETVRDVQEFAFGLIKPGVLLKEYENQIEVYMGEKLRELGLIKSISSETVREYFPHRTSHFLGLNTHDVGDYDRPLEPGVVMTVEPGIYIPEEGIGVRIEDDVLITAHGFKILSNKLPRALG